MRTGRGVTKVLVHPPICFRTESVCCCVGMMTSVSRASNWNPNSRTLYTIRRSLKAVSQIQPAVEGGNHWLNNAWARRISLTLRTDHSDICLPRSLLTARSEQHCMQVFHTHKHISLKELGEVLEAPFYRLNIEVQRGDVINATSEN